MIWRISDMWPPKGPQLTGWEPLLLKMKKQELRSSLGPLERNTTWRLLYFDQKKLIWDFWATELSSKWVKSWHRSSEKQMYGGIVWISALQPRCVLESDGTLVKVCMPEHTPGQSRGNPWVRDLRVRPLLSPRGLHVVSLCGQSWKIAHSLVDSAWCSELRKMTLNLASIISRLELNLVHLGIKCIHIFNFINYKHICVCIDIYPSIEWAAICKWGLLCK